MHKVKLNQDKRYFLTKNFKFKNYIESQNYKNKVGEIGDKDRLLNNISKKVINKNFNINIYGNDYKTKDGTCIRDYMHVYDLAAIHLICLKNLNTLKNV